jgi:hypothetical protein
MKKSLIFWFAAITCAALFLVGCESPTNGEAGAAGSPGSVTFSGPVTAAELARAFAKSNEVILQSTVTSVYGVIPAGKTLAVFGSGTAVAAGESLEVAGALEIEAGAALDASYVSAKAGYLKGTASGVTGAGTVKLPYVGAAGSLPEGGIDYTAGVAAVRAAGSYITGAVPGSALTNANIAAIFAIDDGPDELTVSDITALTDAAVPAGKTLTLTGTNNFSTALDLSSKGTLIVDGTLATNASGIAITANGTTSNITINGTLTLANASDTVAGKVTNNGTITTSSTTPGTVAGLLGLEGTGTVEIGASLALTAAAALTQNVRIPSGVTLTAHSVAVPFSGTKTITIDESGTLALVAANTSVGVTVVNNGTITTATTSDTALQTIVNLGGAIDSTGDVSSTAATPFTVPGGTILTKSSGTFVGGSGALTIDGEATFTTGTFESQTGAVTINGTAEFTAATFAGLTGSAGTAIVTVGPAGNATFTAATFAGTTVGDIVINGAATFGAAAVPGGDVKVGATGTLTVPTGGSLTIDDGKTLANAGTVALTGTGSLVLTSAVSTSGAKITGAGKVTAGKTEIVGGTSGWQAVGTHSSYVTIASVDADTASIAGASGEVFTAQGAGATITQLAGANNALTIAADTVIDLATGGSIVLKKQTASETVATLTFTANSSIVKAGTGAATNSVTNGALTTALAANNATGAAAESAITGKAAGSGTSTLTQIIGDSSKSITGPTNTATGDCTISGNLAVTGS